MSARVGLVIVSHSDLLARGVVEVASQMAPDVRMEAAGGTDDLSLGTSFDRISSAVTTLLDTVGEEAGAGAVVLTDLGSATLTAESVLEFADDPEHLVLADAPLVEGAVAAAVRAQLGDALQDVAAAARSARVASGATGVSSPEPAPVVRAEVSAPVSAEENAQAEATVHDPAGLHARPAAQLARLAGTFDAEVRVEGADAGSVLEVMALGVHQGDRVRLSATGPDARAAVAALVDLLESGH